MKKLFLSLFAAVVALATLVSCTVVSATSIELDTTNAKVKYVIGEELDTTGVMVKVTYSDETTKDVVIGSCVVDSSAYNKDAAGTYTIKVTYDKVYAEYSVTVEEAVVADPVMVGLQIDASKAKVSYLVGEGLITDGIVVGVLFDNGEVAAYSGNDYVIDDSAYNKDVAGEYEIKVSLTIDGVELTGSYSVNVEAIEAPFEGESHKFVASELLVKEYDSSISHDKHTYEPDVCICGDKGPIAEGTIYDDYFTIKGSVTQRINEEGKQSVAIEIQKRSTGKLEFVVTGRAFVVLTVSSNGSSNTSAFALVNEISATIPNDQELSLVTGTDGITVTYTLEEGTYSIVSPNTADYGGRGVRVLQVEVIEDASYVNPDQGGDEDEVEEPQTRVFDVTAIDATDLTDKGDIAGGTSYQDFFYIIGTVTSRVTTAEDGTKSVTSFELGKEDGGKIRFELKHPANVTVVSASTGGSNESVIALVNEAGEVIPATLVASDILANDSAGITHVTSTAKSSFTYELEPGVYELTSPAGCVSIADGTTKLSRNVRVFSITVAEYAAEAEKNPIESFTLTADILTNTTTKKELMDGKWGELVSIKTNNTSGWSVEDNTKKVLDMNGNELSVSKRLKSEGGDRYLEIDLTGYEGKVKLQISVMAAGAGDRTIAVVDALGAELVSLTTNENSEMHVIEVVVDCGAIYQVTTSNGYNFYAINFIAVAE